jgi:hypothetical protein
MAGRFGPGHPAIGFAVVKVDAPHPEPPPCSTVWLTLFP